MALLRIVFFYFVLSLAARAVEIRFVPATAEGVVSLGIYDASGKLVRLLCDEWPMSSFTAELNGLSTDWDGKDSEGQPVPAGTYHARGFVIGDVDVEGEAFHFNDWVSSADSPRITSVDSVVVLPEGGLLLAARLVGGKSALLRYLPQSPNPWQTVSAEILQNATGPVKVAFAAGRVFVLADKKVRILDLATGQEVPALGIPSEVADISTREDRLLLLADNKLRILDAANLSEVSNLPVPETGAIRAALLDGQSIALAGPDGWLWHGGPSWNQINLPEGTKATALAAGRGATFWALEKQDGHPAMVVQYSPEEGRLAEWTSSGSGSGTSLAAATEEDYFCAVFREPGLERTVAIRRGAAGGWQLVTDKTITANGSFGWSEGKLAPSSGDVPTDLTLNLTVNPLDPVASRSLPVRAAQFAGGTGLVTADGLPLVRVSEEQGFARVMVMPGAQPDTARFFQGDGACVEEYNLIGLGNITAFDAGTIEMESGAEKPAPPEEEVPDPTP